MVDRFKISYMLMAFILFCCSTGIQGEIGAQASSSSTSSSKKILSIEADEECRLYQSYQYDYWKNRNYRRTIYCNMQMMEELGCDESEKYKPNYYNLSRSFIELENPQADSAYWALKQGLKIDKNDESLLELGAYVSRKVSDVEQQIYYLDRVISINEHNGRVLEQLCDIYGEEEKHEEQITIIDLWLKLDLDDISYRKAIGEKKQAYQALGRETSDVDKERWEADPSNAQNGVFFLEALKELEEFEELVRYSDQMLVYNRTNLRILELKADSYLTLYEYGMARDVYEELYLIDNNYRYAIEISKILVEQGTYESAYAWSEKALSRASLDENKFAKGESFFQRAEVLYSTAQGCQSTSGELNFWDKIVYEIALDDYIQSYNNGQYNAATRKKFLEENYITTASDWFLSASGVLKASPSKRDDKIVPSLKSCYSWISREVESK